MRPLPPGPIFCRDDLRALGWSDPAIGRAARAGTLIRLRRGVFARETTDITRALAASGACGGSVVSHRSAALVHHVPLLDRPPVRPDLTVLPHATGDVADALLHRATLWDGDVLEIPGGRVTAPLRTAADLARTLSLGAAVVSLDAMLHRGMVDRGGVADYVRRCSTWPGARRARLAMGLLDGRSESPLESVSRLVMIRVGLPAPRLQPVIRDVSGRILARGDFYWDEFGVVGEADGRVKYTEREVLDAEKDRQEELEDLNLVIARWGWHAVRFDQPRWQDRLLRAFERGRRRDSAGIPRLWTVDD